MTYLADENIPLITVQALQEKDIEIRSIFDIARGIEDEDILSYAFKHNHIVLTFDKDFGALVFRKKQPSKGVILFRFPPKSPEFITSIIYQVLSNPQFDPERKFVVVNETHVRSVPLPSL